jgi:hypothetical protein
VVIVAPLLLATQLHHHLTINLQMSPRGSYGSLLLGLMSLLTGGLRSLAHGQACQVTESGKTHRMDSPSATSASSPGAETATV